jgi:hypothetical protein
MALDTVIDYPCRPKKDLGSGDLRAGTRTLVDLLKSRSQAETVRALSAQDGRAADDVPVRLVVLGAGGVAEEKTLSVRELEGRAAALDPHVTACTNCPANARRVPFGCVAMLKYPIRRSAEQWVLDRLQPPGAIGGALCLQSIEEMGYDGSVTRGLRARGLFESPEPLVKELPANPFGRTRVTTDELLHPLLTPAGRLVPWHLLAFLMWIGGVKVDDAVPQSPDDGLKLTRLEPADRPKRAKLALGPAATDPGVEQFRDLLKALFVGWARDVDLLVNM